MPIRNLVGCAAALLLLTGCAPAADPVQCPAQLQVRQQPLNPPAGWVAATDTLPNVLAGVTFFDGKPEDNASLAPDKQSRLNGKDLAVWNFAAGNAQPVYFSCRYAWTTIVLQKQLPKTVRSCTVTYNPKQTVAGLPEIEKIDCK